MRLQIFNDKFRIITNDGIQTPAMAMTEYTIDFQLDSIRFYNGFVPKTFFRLYVSDLNRDEDGFCTLPEILELFELRNMRGQYELIGPIIDDYIFLEVPNIPLPNDPGREYEIFEFYNNERPIMRFFK